MRFSASCRGGRRRSTPCGPSFERGRGPRWRSSRRDGCRRRSRRSPPPTRVARPRSVELTKRFEEVAVATAAALAERFREPPKGEITLVIGPPQAAEGRGEDVEARAAVADLVAAGTPRRVAADVVSRLTGSSRNALYRSTL